MYKPFNKWLGKSWKSLLLEPSAERKESITPKPWRPRKRADTSEDHFVFMGNSRGYSKEVLKSNFRQYGQMEKQRWEESEKKRFSRKKTRGCGGKHILQSKCWKHFRLGALLEGTFFQKSTQLWHEAHVRIKIVKTHHSRATFGCWDVEKVHAAVARSTFASQKC